MPLLVRAVPEILVGPYPVGFDTIAFYVPNTLDWAAGKAGFLEMLGTAPLMYMISVPAYLLLRVNPVWIFKIMGPVLYGVMILALFRFLQSGLRWTERRSLGGAVLTSLYFVTLRVGWDMYRLMLGLTFVLLTLTLLNGREGRTKQALLPILIVLAVASDQLTGVVVLFLVGARVLTGMMKGQRREVVELVKTGTPGVVLFFAIVYAGLIAPGIGLVQEQALPSLDSLSTSVGFLGYAYLALAPLILLGFRKVGNSDLRSWSISCIGLALTALLPFFGPIVMSYRWSLLLAIPFCVYAAAGLSRLHDAPHLTVGLARALNRSVFPIFAILLMASAILYIALPAQSAFAYYTAFPALLPTSMVQDTVPMSDMDSLMELMGWAAVNLSPGTALITHQAIYGWARAYFPLSDKIVNYEYSSPLVGVETAKLQGYSSTLMIWWVNGSGWHGQPTVPMGFTEQVQKGNLAVYSYNDTYY